MLTLAEAVSGFNVWYLLSTAIILVIADFFFFSTTVLLAIGIGLLLPIIANAADLQPQIQLWSYPLGLFLGFLTQPFMMRNFTKKSHPYELEKEFVGSHGIVILTTEENAAENHFYQYKKGIANEDTPEALSSFVSAKLKLSSGETFPIEQPHTDLRDGSEAVIQGFVGNAVIIKVL